jgi:hypothetical protein
LTHSCSCAFNITWFAFCWCCGNLTFASRKPQKTPDLWFLILSRRRISNMHSLPAPPIHIHSYKGHKFNTICHSLSPDRESVCGVNKLYIGLKIHIKIIVYSNLAEEWSCSELVSHLNVMRKSALDIHTHGLCYESCKSGLENKQPSINPTMKYCDFDLHKCTINSRRKLSEGKNLALLILFRICYWPGAL